MIENTYDRLVTHLGGGDFSDLPKNKDLMGMLEILFTPEQGEFVLNLPIYRAGAITAEDLATKMNKDIEYVTGLVESLAKEGKVHAIVDKVSGKLVYSLLPLVPGMMESIFSDGVENESRAKLATLWANYFEPGTVVNLTASKSPLLRIIPINSNLEATSRVMPYEEISHIIENAGAITVIPCLCRSLAKKCNHILEADVVLGDWAEYLINYRGARRWTVPETLQRMRECEEDGLLHLTGNIQEGTHVICNCCPCCCGALRTIIEYNGTTAVASTNYEPRVTPEECTLCLKCKEICPVGAITEVSAAGTDGATAGIQVNSNRCLGCGLCSTHCPTNAIRMVKVRDSAPAKTAKEMVERYVAERFS